MTVSRTRLAQVGLIAWAAVSAVAALQPPGVGGMVRALDTALFMLSAPALAGLLAARRARYASPSVAPTIPLPVELLLWSSASIAMLTLSSTALLVAGAWSVHAMVWLVTTETVVLALWPVASSGKRVRSG